MYVHCSSLHPPYITSHTMSISVRHNSQGPPSHVFSFMSDNSDQTAVSSVGVPSHPSGIIITPIRYHHHTHQVSSSHPSGIIITPIRYHHHTHQVSSSHPSGIIITPIRYHHHTHQVSSSHPSGIIITPIRYHHHTHQVSSSHPSGIIITPIRYHPNIRRFYKCLGQPSFSLSVVYQHLSIVSEIIYSLIN